MNWFCSALECAEVRQESAAACKADPMEEEVRVAIDDESCQVDLSDALFAEGLPEKGRGMQLQALEIVGRSEKWLIASDQIFLSSLAAQVVAARPGISGKLNEALESGVCLGRGGFAVVLRGTYLGMKVALKLASHENMATLPSEMRLLRWLRHPNIVTFYGACIVEVEQGIKELELVEELVQGRNLREYLEDHNSLTCDHQFVILIGICSALAYLHFQNPAIVHGDLKPDNVLLQVPGLGPKLIDFGFSRAEDALNEVPGMSSLWAAPEVLTKSMGHPTSAADMFSFGRIVFNVVTGIRPLREASFRQLTEWAATGFPALLWPESLEREEDFTGVCAECLRMVASQRPAASVVLDRLISMRQDWIDRMDSDNRSVISRCTSLSSKNCLQDVLVEASQLRSSSKEHRSTN
eukprot:TRINITY_DN3497_c0_g1_i1.p1 TRINITY_DN3497_c0_g1~~TRINITY_DN3497_c0_g1_i1.p1  ORF type:complete len:410 (+),score=59.13 TRINITY_DN3497_c0_g1_i1:84-1313(+)